MVEEIIEFGLEKVSPSIIMVAGVGGGGSNAVNHMFELGIADVTFMVCNTDKQALYRSPVPIKVRLGEALTEGLGAGNNPEKGKNAAIESLDEITAVFKEEGTKMVFITAGMGGGTGTGAAPVIAKAAKELGILTVAIVTMPFKTEGKKRAEHARQGIAELRNSVDSLLVINNEKIQEIYGKLTLTEAFGKADDILALAAKGIAEIITGDGVVNVDFADVKTVMTDSGVTMMGTGRASGEDRALNVAELSMSSPLLNHNYITGAHDILINITYGQQEVTMEESNSIRDYIQDQAGNEANIIWGAAKNDMLDDDLEVTIIATRFGQETNDIILGSDYKYIASTIQPQKTGILDVPAGSLDSVLSDSTFSGGTFGSLDMGSQRSIVDQELLETTLGSRVIRLEVNNLYANIEEVLSVPAFKRRKIKFVRDSADNATKSSKVSMQNTVKDKKKVEDSANLFDI